MSTTQSSHSLGRRSGAILATLRQELASGAYPPGSRLPGEVELGARFGVSRNTVRKAVACLSASGLVTVRKGAGMFVPLPSDEGKSSTISMMGYFTAEELADLQGQALAAGHLLCVYSQVEAHWQPAQERLFLERVWAERHRGLIAFLSPLEPRNDDMATALAGAGVRIVHMDYTHEQPPAQGCHLCDYQQAGRLAAVELLLAGYDQVRMVRTSSAPFEELLERGFADALADHGGGFSAAERFDWRGQPAGLAGGEPLLAASLAKAANSVGVLCASPGVAAAVLRAAAASGRRLPEDVGLVVLCLNRRDADNLPHLDTLVYDRHQAYREALAAVLAAEWRPPRIIQPPVLVRRGSLRGRAASASMGCES